ncbi:mechanosensitive ion channel family protein [Halobacteriales archaeon SW_7_71_33]|nr:MAG: mechanosensitive ion channel family protein [Halobacteriales archaeon SW_7_71_33]
MSPGGLRRVVSALQSGVANETSRQVDRLTGGVPDPLVNLVGALLVLLVGWYSSRLLVRYFGRPLAKRFGRPSIARTVLRGVRAGVLVLTGLVALTVLGLDFPDILVSVTVFSAVVGVILAPIVGSIVNGVFVIADQPFEIGDMIELADTGTRGFVEDVTLRYTKMFTLDNTFIVIPNGNIRDRDVINYSAEDERTRLSLDVVVTYEGDLAAARDLVERAASDVDGVISGGPGIRVGAARYPAKPTCYIDQFGDNGVRLRLRYWAEQPYKLLTVRSEVQTRVWDALADADVEIAYPHQHHVFDETSGQARVRIDDADGDGDGNGNGRARSSPTDGRAVEGGPTTTAAGLDPEGENGPGTTDAVRDGDSRDAESESGVDDG